MRILDLRAIALAIFILNIRIVAIRAQTKALPDKELVIVGIGKMIIPLSAVGSADSTSVGGIRYLTHNPDVSAVCSTDSAV